MVNIESASCSNHTAESLNYRVSKFSVISKCEFRTASGERNDNVDDLAAPSVTTISWENPNTDAKHPNSSSALPPYSLSSSFLSHNAKPSILDLAVEAPFQIVWDVCVSAASATEETSSRVSPLSLSWSVELILDFVHLRQSIPLCETNVIENVVIGTEYKFQADIPELKFSEENEKAFGNMALLRITPKLSSVNSGLGEEKMIDDIKVSDVDIFPLEDFNIVISVCRNGTGDSKENNWIKRLYSPFH